MNTYAFIDGQNVHLGTKADGWSLDLVKFRIYLRDKYKVNVAYYFLGCVSDDNELLYDQIQKAGFVLKFREHGNNLKGTKKGNVDTDVVFELMRHYIDEPTMDQAVLVSGDGDYKKVVDYLISKEKFLKLLFPNVRHSSLYKRLGNEYTDMLGRFDLRQRIEKKAEEKEKGA